MSASDAAGRARRRCRWRLVGSSWQSGEPTRRGWRWAVDITKNSRGGPGHRAVPASITERNEDEALRKHRGRHRFGGCRRRRPWSQGAAGTTTAAATADDVIAAPDSGGGADLAAEIRGTRAAATNRGTQARAQTGGRRRCRQGTSGQDKRNPDCQGRSGRFLPAIGRWRFCPETPRLRAGRRPVLSQR